MLATQELTPINISQQLSEFAERSPGELIKMGRGFATLVARNVLKKTYKLDPSTMESQSNSKIKFILLSFQPTPLPCRHKNLAKSPPRLTIWVVNEGGKLLGAFQKLGNGEFIQYAATQLQPMGTAAPILQLFHITLNKMREAPLSIPSAHGTSGRDAARDRSTDLGI